MGARRSDRLALNIQGQAATPLSHAGSCDLGRMVNDGLRCLETEVQSYAANGLAVFS